ncbi:MAG: DUF1998 domain-containing protein [Actinobacteria bacterium]|nr:DUF1998 domain-containing protein [Actinomycetota bacterium]
MSRPGRRGLPTGGGGRGGGTDPTRIGQIRPSQLITTTGVGAIADLPAMSVIIRGLDAWAPERQDPIDEPRLLAEVRGVLGGQVRALRSAPWDPQADDDPWTRVGVPVTPFPRWVRCPACFRLGVVDGSEFRLVHRWGRRPDLAKFVHQHCPKQTGRRDTNRRSCIPARFVVACDDGHLDDFPYVEFVHHGRSEPCGGPQLSMSDAASTLSPRVLIRCTECRTSRSISEATGRSGWQVLPRCRGRHPHLQRFDECGRRLRLMVLGASNMWFAATASALHLPHGRDVTDLVAAHWEILGQQPSADVTKMIIDGMDALRELRGVPIEDLWKQVESLRATGGPQQPEPSGDLLDAEWELLSRPTTDRQDADFHAEPAPATPDGYDRLLDQVVLVSRLREVQALVGFTRLSAPERRDLCPRGRVPLANAAETWVPAAEQRGEGIFLELREPAVAAWVERVRDHPRIQALDAAFARWSRNRDRDPTPGFPLPRYLLIHTLSHLLIRQVALECGYSSASIRERLYIGRASAPAAGVLLSTAASDSEGTLGGLVALGQPRHLKRLLDGAFREAERCSSDPLCAEHVPLDPSDALHAAACHACLFASETSCEANNRLLDRAVLVDLTGDGLAFPR